MPLGRLISSSSSTVCYKQFSYLLCLITLSALLVSRITKVYATEIYDYPTAIQESISEMGTTIGHGITNFAAANLKGTNLPAPAPAAPIPQQHKTLPHALGRAATNAAAVLHSTPSAADDKFAKAVAGYAGAWEKISDARVTHDQSISAHFLQPWQQTLSTSINVAMKARQAVRVSRLELDAAKQTFVYLSYARYLAN
jgi:hypothetical protein